MKGILNNKKITVVLSISSVLYMLYLLSLAYNTFFYKFVITSQIGFALFYILINILFVSAMFFSRKEKLTSILSILFLFVIFWLLIFNFNQAIVFLPPMIVSIFMFFACKGNETFKTIVGTLYLLLYILGIIIFVLSGSFFGDRINGTVLTKNINSKSELLTVYSQDKIDKIVEGSVSPDKKYRFYIADVKNSAKGQIQIIVTPNDMDKKHLLYSLEEKGREKIVGFIKSRGNDSLPEVKWIGDNKIQYQFPGQPLKTSVIKESDVKKNYFSFLNL